MKIALSTIKGLDRRVRKQMSPEKLDELTDSIKELGQIVPIKVRKNGDGYVLIYGHRRVQAAKAAGMKQIEAIVENVPDDALLTQSLAENVIREDMAAIDIAKALRLILDETGATQTALGARLGWTERNVAAYLVMLDPELGLTKAKSISVGVMHVKEANAGTGGDLRLAAQVLKRAGDDELSARATRKVAEVVRRANDFGGARAVKSALSRTISQIEDEGEDILSIRRQAQAERERKSARASRSNVAFAWIRQPVTGAAYAAVQDLSALARGIRSAKERGDLQDRAAAKQILRQVAKGTRTVLAEYDKLIETI